MWTGTLILIFIFTTISEHGGILGAGETPVEEKEIPDVTCKTTRSGSTFKGKVAVTGQKMTCQRWDAQSPNQHSYNKTDMFPDATVEEAASYCRNPSNNQYGPWCYVGTRFGGRQYCGQIPFCKGVICEENGSRYRKNKTCICKLTDGYERDECEALKSVAADTAQQCIKRGKRSNTWVSYNPKNKDCKLYGKKDISQGVMARKPGDVNHYFVSASACDLLKSSPYQQCLRYRDANFVGDKMEDPYSGFVCRKGIYGSESLYAGEKVQESDVKSDINAWKKGGPISTLTVQEHFYNISDEWETLEMNVLTMKILYGSEVVQRGSRKTEDPKNVETTTVKIAQDDCINRIEVHGGTYGDWNYYAIDKLIFHTRNGIKIGPFGKAEGEGHDVRAPEGTCLAFMDHLADTYLKGLAFIFEPLTKFPHVA